VRPNGLFHLLSKNIFQHYAHRLIMYNSLQERCHQCHSRMNIGHYSSQSFRSAELQIITFNYISDHTLGIYANILKVKLNDFAQHLRSAQVIIV
jgi:hypothetical protein